MLTGGASPGIRAEEWKSKRVFFMTPQTLINDCESEHAETVVEASKEFDHLHIRIRTRRAMGLINGY
jgi:ERCC4-related helicase